MSREVRDTVGVLASRSLLPKNIELSQIGPISIVNSYDGLSEKAVAKNSVFTGFDLNPSTALIKSLSEYFERKAMLTEALLTPDLFNCFGSDGLAAYPVYRNRSEAEKKSRRIAIYEAVERYSWVKWWHDDSKNFSIQNRIDGPPNQVERSIFQEINKAIEFKEIFLVTLRVYISEIKSMATVAIYILKSKNNGYICGSGCGATGMKEQVELKALCEMFRHCLGYCRIVNNNKLPQSMYEERLVLYGSGSKNHSDSVSNRLGRLGNCEIELPDLQWDYPVKHDCEDIFLVHRALFENHPIFIQSPSDGFYL